MTKSLRYVLLARMKSHKTSINYRQTMKYALGLCLISAIVFSCSNSKEQRVEKSLLGKPLTITMGVEKVSIDQAVDSMINDMQYLFSNKDTGSVMYKYNHWIFPDSLMPFVDREALFSQVYDYVFELNTQTYGYFDPSLTPLAEARSKLLPGYELDDAVIDEMMLYCGLSEDNFELREYQNESGNYEKSFLSKHDGRSKIDLSSFVGAYTLDIIRYYLVENDIDVFRLEWNGIVVNQGFEDEDYRYYSVTLPGNLGEQKLNILNRAVAYSDQDAVKEILAGSLVYPSENTTTNTFVMSGSAAVAWAYSQAFSAMGAQEMQVFFEESPTRDIEVTMIFEKAGEFYAASTPGIDTLWFSDDTPTK